MLPSVATLCCRNGATMSVMVAKLPLILAVKKPASNLYGAPPPAAARLVLRPGGPQVRWFSLTASIRRQNAEVASHPEENFGTLSADIASRRSFRKVSPEVLDMSYQEDDDDQKPKEPLRRPGRRNTTYWYFLQCKKLIKAEKLQEALELFESEMLRGERLQPEEYNYSVLIGGCGRAGQLKKAFKLYNNLKKRGLEASDATYTALFNACAESPHKHMALEHTLKLEQELKRKNVTLCVATYHAILKTHAFHNNLQACIHTIKEMLDIGHTVTQETFHYLLMGCLKDKELGFRLALQVWRQMLKSGLIPDSKNYNLLLRTARDCGIGDPALAFSLLLLSNESHVKSRKGVDIDLLERQLLVQPEIQSCGGETKNSLVPPRQAESTLYPVSVTPNLLDLLEGKSDGSVISFGDVEGASNRLALLGGGQGFLEKMTAGGLEPDLRTLTLLADIMVPGVQSLEMLLKVAKQHRIKLDAAFFNTVIHRTARSGDLDGAKDVLRVMRQRKMSISVQTFGSLAMGCQKQKDGLQLLQDMEEAGLQPNAHVFSTLIGRASRRLDYVYLKTLLKSMRDKGVWPNVVIIKQLEFAAQYPPNYDQYKSRNNYLVQIDGFRGYYEQWLQTMPAQGDQDDQQDSSVATVKSQAQLMEGAKKESGVERIKVRNHTGKNSS
ncbi:pentatricopeptide repeat-containing protein 1, mitochondrial [Corythoichthys intestinalis]|uniref:pentatricopeptide repeat-containing protein 1, mitochondrial n=1 Tax=Corythoichthys intestinalis TaxID=161448 RepID=UPI0025A57073|nr:pentatricopeptide repeat-containing protein 1, mitochondrial [Corythoichthys intestinalis]XP_061791849.1 pentatricopeptide repeat-containing protein 1, mitochondrial-like [Nerophis lumbriciformis]